MPAPVCAACPLTILVFPIFTAELYGESVYLRWTTATELNNDYFTVERLNNADFEALFVVQGAGNSHTVLPYSGIDKNPLYGTSYYRLKQTDFDGTFTYSQIAVVNLEVIEKINLFPNPAENEINYTVTSSLNTRLTMEIIDIRGAKIITKTRSIDKGINSGSIQISRLSTGVYFIRVTTEAPHINYYPGAMFKFFKVRKD